MSEDYGVPPEFFGTSLDEDLSMEQECLGFDAVPRITACIDSMELQMMGIKP